MVDEVEAETDEDLELANEAVTVIVGTRDDDELELRVMKERDVLADVELLWLIAG